MSLNFENVDNYNKFCTACLNVLDDSVNYTAFNTLRKEYVTLVGFEVSGIVSLCYICRSIVRKYFKFRMKCLQLHELLAQHRPLQIVQDVWNHSTGQLVNIAKSELVIIDTEEFDDNTVLSDSTRYLEKSSGIWDKSDKHIKYEYDNMFENGLNPEIVKTELDSNDSRDSDCYGVDFGSSGNEVSTKKKSISRHVTNSKLKKRRHKTKSKFKEKEHSTKRKNEDLELAQLNMRAIILSHEEQLGEIEERRRSDQYLNALFKCERCGTGFAYEDSYNSHSSRHNQLAGGAHECSVCGVRFSSVRTLWSHRSNHRRRYECIACGRKVAQRRDCAAHRVACPNQDGYTPAGGMFSCDICGKQSRSEYSLKRHRRRAHFAKRKHQCHLCDQMFVNVQALRDHLVVHSGERPFVCSECGSGFPSKSRLQQHQTMHIRSKDFYCPTCDLCFPTQRRLASHLKVGAKHIAPQLLRHACTKCDRRFYTTRSLQLHMDRSHLNVLRYQCTECTRAYSAPNALVLHMRKVHPDKAPARKRCIATDGQDKKYVCDFCGSAFGSTTILTCHMRRHTGERPLQCPHCDARFAYPSARYTHIRLVHLKLKRSKKTVECSSEVDVTKIRID